MLCLLDGIDLPALFWGAIKIGAVPVPISTMLKPADYDFMLRDSRARVLAVSSDILDRFESILGDQPGLKAVLVSAAAAAESPGGYQSFAALCARVSGGLEPAATVVDEAAFWLYTSGSTGKPKAAVHRHGDLVHTAVLYGEKVLGLSDSDVMFSAAKLFFAYGLGNGMTFPLHAGATAVLMAERPTPEAVMRRLREQRPTVFYGVPTLYASILANPAPDRSTSSDRLRLCVSAGEALPRAWAGDGWRGLASIFLTVSARPRCCIFSSPTARAKFVTAPAASRCLAMTSCCSTKTATSRRTERSATCGAGSVGKPRLLEQSRRVPAHVCRALGPHRRQVPARCRRLLPLRRARRRDVEGGRYMGLAVRGGIGPDGASRRAAGRGGRRP